MKKIYKTIFILLLLIPFLVNAKDLNDLTHKWTETITSGFYDYHRTNPNILKNTYEENRVYEDATGYLIITQTQLNRFDKQNKLIKTVSFSFRFTFIEQKDFLLVCGYDKNDELIVYKFTYQLEELGKDNLKYSELIDIIIEDDKYILLVNDYNTEDKNYFKSIVYDKKLKVLSTSSVFTKYSISEKSSTEDNAYVDYYNNTYYLNDDYNLSAKNKTSNDGQVIFGDEKIFLYDKNESLLKTLTITSDYNIYDTTGAKADNYYYMGVSEYIYDSTKATYTNRLTVYQYDENLAEKNKKIINSTITNYIVNTNFYSNKNGLFIQYSPTYYKVDSSFNFTQASREEIGIKESSYILIKDEYSELLDEIYDEYINDILIEKENALELECANTYDCYFSYNFEVTKYNDEYAIIATWAKHLQDKTTYEETSYISTDLIITSGNSYKTISIIKERETDYYVENDNDLDELVHGAQITYVEDHFIISLSSKEEHTIELYDTSGNFVKELFKEESSMLPTYLSYNNGSLVAIFTEVFREPPPASPLHDTKSSLDSIIITQDDAKIINYYVYGNSQLVYLETPFEVSTKTDGNGKVTATKVKAISGEEIEFTVTPEKGYVLGVVKVTDNDGNTITFTSNKFTMPSSDVVIDVTFVPENPDTATMSLFIITCLLIIGTGIILSIKNIKQINWLKN